MDASLGLNAAQYDRLRRWLDKQKKTNYFSANAGIINTYKNPYFLVMQKKGTGSDICHLKCIFSSKVQAHQGSTNQFCMVFICRAWVRLNILRKNG